MQNEFEKQVQKKMEELNLAPSAPVRPDHRVLYRAGDLGPGVSGFRRLIPACSRRSGPRLRLTRAGRAGRSAAEATGIRRTTARKANDVGGSARSNRQGGRHRDAARMRLPAAGAVWAHRFLSHPRPATR